MDIGKVVREIEVQPDDIPTTREVPSEPTPMPQEQPVEVPAGASYAVQVG